MMMITTEFETCDERIISDKHILYVYVHLLALLRELKHPF